eukprot:Phypoly_transcript_15552.p1 GENE.Phypoly_transcript_15552~~Phypoly_transcript_15552.p1  ORF type:complete len:246 (+),score=32.94 Phypoly_transcript_15552:153-890(+)
MQLALIVFALCIIYVSAYPSHQLRELATGIWSPPAPGSVRGPCPALNTLANHGFLPRNGKNITQPVLANAIETVYGFEHNFAQGFATAGVSQDGVNGILSLDGLDKHNTIEHDASISRNDLFFGDNHSINFTLLQGILSLSKDGTLTQDDIGEWQGMRQRDSALRNPNFTFTSSLQGITSSEPAFILGVFGTVDSTGFWRVSVDRFWSIFGLEQLPQDWTKATVTVDGAFANSLGSAIASKWHTV